MLAPNGLTPEAYARRRQIERERHQNGRTSPTIRITSGATPLLESITQPRNYDTAFGYHPGFTYVTANEYETMKDEGRLQTGEIYIVMN